MISFGLLSISIITLFFSLYVYFRHDLKIKNQSKEINTKKLENLHLEDEQNKKANIEIRVDRSNSKKYVIKVINTGKSLAKYVILKFNDEEFNSSIPNNFFPTDLHSGNFIEIDYYIHKGSPVKVQALITWQDNFRLDNYSTQMVYL